MNIFVTGGAGYIGSATTNALLEAGHSVTVYDLLVTGHRQAVPEGARFIHASLEDSQALAETLTGEKFDAVMHFAAFIEAGESMKDPGRFYQNNLVNSLHLIETSVEAGVERFILSSTAAVYESSDALLTEELPLGPTNVYGHTKLIIEQTLEWYRKIHGLHYAALRYFNACGALPGRGEAHQPESHLIPRVLSVPLGKLQSININGTDYRHPGRYLHPRLHPHCGPGFGPSVGARCLKRSRQVGLQPGKRERILGPRGDRDGARGHRTPDPGDGISPAARRSGPFGGFPRENSPRVGLGSSTFKFERNFRKRVGMA